MRELNPLIEAYIDERIERYNQTVSPNALMIRALKAMVGIHEEGGDNRGPLVAAIQDTVGGPDPLAWCMSLQQTAVAYVEKKLSMVCDLAESEHCLTVLSAAERHKRNVKVPAPGDLIIWQHGASTDGHVGCITMVGDYFQCIEGNTAGHDQRTGVVSREGDGVYETMRSRNGSQNMKVAGFVRLQFEPRGKSLPN
jgi:hypothetical protein